MTKCHIWRARGLWWARIRFGNTVRYSCGYKFLSGIAYWQRHSLK